MKLINKNIVVGTHRKLLATMLFVAFSVASFAQSNGVGIGTSTPDASAILDVTATNKGLLLPRVANTGVIAAPVNGLVIYDMSTDCVKVYQDNAWSDCLIKPPLTIADIVAVSTSPAAGGTPSLLDLVAVGVTGITGNQATYEAAIANGQPTTLAELQAIIDAN